MAKKMPPRNASNGRPSAPRRGPRSSASPAPTPATAPPAVVFDATHADIARRAYELYLARGSRHGQDVDDWIQAQRELVRTASPTG